MKIKWKDEYSCYEPNIDEQHKKLVELINSMEELASLDDDMDHFDEIMHIFNELKDYTVYHFQSEEEAFEKYGYDSFNKKVQALEHKAFVEKMSAINIREIDENQKEAVNGLLDFAANWLSHHILHTDKQFGEFLLDNHKL